MKLMILDGNSVINRAFYGVRLLSTRDGQYTNAIYGFLNILDKMRQEEQPDALCVAFDLHGPTFRHEKYDGYKATRHGMPEELAQQMPVMKDVLRAMNIPIYACQGWEADDVIGTVAKRCAAAGWDCVVVTGDRDSLQLVDGHVSVKLIVTKGGQTNSTNYDPAVFRAEYGFEPIRLIDLKALMGDSSDNIPGVAGVGPKTAMELLHKYGTLDGVYENLTPQNMKGKLYEKLTKDRDKAYLSFDLATIRLDAPIDFAPEDALVKDPDRAALYDLFMRLEFVKLIDKYRLRGAGSAGAAIGRPQAAAGPDSSKAFPLRGRWPEGPDELGSDAADGTDPDGNTTSSVIRLAGDGGCRLPLKGKALAVPAAKAEFDDLVEGWKSAEYVALTADEDLETLALDDGAHPALLSRAALGLAWDFVLPTLFSGGLRLAVHGAKELIRRLLERCLPAEGIVFDTELAAYLLDAARGKYELDTLALRYCQTELPGEEELAAGEDPSSVIRLAGDGGCHLPPRGKAESAVSEDPSSVIRLAGDGGCHLPPRGKAESAVSGDPSSVIGLAGDARCHLPPRGKALSARAAAILGLIPPLTAGLKEQALETLFSEMELPLCPVLAEMEVEGVLVDAEALHAFDEMLRGRIGEIRAEICRCAGGEFNLNSPKQLGELLFDRLGLPAGKKRSTSADVLEKLRDKHPIVGRILEYRTLTKLQATYAEGLLKVVGPDGRVRTTFQNTVTATGRLSSTEPNLQNIPVRTDLGAEIRKMFVPAPGWVFVDADYSQIELRVLAHMAGDEAMQAAFNSGEDIHRVTASQVFGVPPEAVTPQMRRSAKAVNFGIVYGISGFSLAEDLGVSQAEAKSYIDSYLNKYHGVRDYMAGVVEQGTKEGWVATLYGRRRYLPELKDGKYLVREAARRMAMNSPIQGTAADIIKLAMLRVDRALKAAKLEARLVLQVHDELIVECPEAEADAVAALVTREMEAAAKLSVPLTAEAKIGRSWYEAK